jgi:hypothetical protein
MERSIERTLETPKLDPRASKYLHALVDPYDTGEGSCCPDKVARKTARFKVLSKGVMATGTVGFGFIGVDPLGMAYSNATAGTHSTAAYTGTDFSNNVGVTGVSGFSSTSEFNTSSIASLEMGCRIVACGVRIRCTTPFLNVGGSVCGVYQPDFQSLHNETFSDILLYPQVHTIAPKNDKWIHVEYTPLTAELFEFDDTAPSTSNADTLPLGICVAAPTGGSLDFDWEVYAHLEFVGKIMGLMDPYVDPLAQAAILQTMAELDGSASDQWITSLGKIIKKTEKTLGAVSGAAASAVSIASACAALLG